MGKNECQVYDLIFLREVMGVAVLGRSRSSWAKYPARKYKKTSGLTWGQEQLQVPCWIGGHFTSPYEQYTQQSPDLGFNSASQFRQS